MQNFEDIMRIHYYVNLKLFSKEKIIIVAGVLNVDVLVIWKVIQKYLIYVAAYNLFIVIITTPLEVVNFI